MSTLKLEEGGKSFSAIGDSSISINKPDGCTSGRFHGIPIAGAITPKSIDQFRIDNGQEPPRMYLDWGGLENAKRHTLIGEIGDIQEAEDWITRVNLLYSTVSTE